MPERPSTRWWHRVNPENAGSTATRTMRSSSTDRPATKVPRAELVQRYRQNRVRTRELFGLIREDAYYSQPIALRHPIVFYEGHLPGFSFNTLVKKALGGASID